MGRKKDWNIKDHTGVKYEEGLPNPYVKYKWGNWIIEFGKSKKNFKICECFKTPIENHIKELKSQWEKFYGYGSWDRSYRRGELGDYYMNWYRRYLKGYRFEPNICHRCNNMTPSVEFCNPMYGGKFKRSFGWYIKRREYSKEFGTEKSIEYRDLEKKVESIKSSSNSFFSILKNLFSTREKVFRRGYEKEKQKGKLERKMNKIVENIVRGEFGFKPIGQLWVNETIIFKIVKEIFPNSEVIHHYRGKELEGLEIDVYIKDKKIGFEYNGIQHYKPIKFFGGKKSFEKTKKRDQRKIELCEQLGINLLIVKYDEVVSKQLIKSKLSSLMEL
jgi:hypothetical protein